MYGFGRGGLLIAIDHMLKGFSLRAFSSATFGLLLGTVVAELIDHNELFIFGADKETRWVIRLGLFLSFGYLGMILAMRSNKEDFSLIIPYVRFNGLAVALKPSILPGEMLNLRIVREGKDKGQGVAYLNDGTMVVINQAQALIGQQVHAQVTSLLQTGAGVIIFAELKLAAA